MRPTQPALEVLDRIESLELRSLEWGSTDGSLSELEAEALANSVSDNGEELLEQLIEANLIFELPRPNGEIRFRSRFGEMMRLLAANRQLFPGRPWQGSPELVSDFRVDRRRRRFPRRDRLPDVLLSEYGDAIAAGELGRSLWSALVGAPGLKLAGFQERAALRLATNVDDGGTIVTAGTGSGKTLAFYLPAMIRIGKAVDQNRWVKALAIYPRIELLKDQFAEAFAMARRVDGPMHEHGKRPISLGALYGATPSNATIESLKKAKWASRGGDFVCPWMRCPSCDSELVWRRDTLTKGKEVLDCVGETCGVKIDATQVVLTRQSQQQRPPDILFTTTEMLNQRLSDHWTRGLFGVGNPPGRRPFLALLDEVHTYEGTSGAQAALTLRRWRHLLRAPVSWVGLSATLTNAADFFADLCGAPSGKVVEITPSAEEFIEEGVEYQVLLRGNPAARASLLSTTIQTSMLLPRLLNPPEDTRAFGAFGQRAFLFTDDLDVTNRLFDDLRDAEAYTIFGKPDPARTPLASLRGVSDDAVTRDTQGQRWRVCEDIGHRLDQRLIVGRTTSQDGGVNHQANVVVATTALEVGFNDPQVGAVIQHKAPRGMASFLQRKGRAGRSRDMRPIMLTVLSDYGRDRAFFQAFEQLFDPILEAQSLPIQNPYILKMQAVFAFFDWLAERTVGPSKGWQWDLLSRPTSSTKDVLKATKRILGQIVQGKEATITDLRLWLEQSLSVDQETAESLLWEAPRSLLLEAVPTLVRRVFRNWQLAIPSDKGNLDLQLDFHPLPDFVPRNLFSDLALPEVRIIVPPATKFDEERVEAMPILQALNQFPPGRVSRRFAFERGALSHWIPIEPAPTEQIMEVGVLAEESEYIGTFVGRMNGGTNPEAVPVYRPWTMRLDRVTRSEALPSSNARHKWETDITPNGDALKIPFATRSSWGRYMSSVNFHLHRFRSSANVRRFSRAADAVLRTQRDEFHVETRFAGVKGEAAALGFELEVDGLRIELNLPEDSELAERVLPEAVKASARLAYLRDSFVGDNNLPLDFNEFQRGWIFEFLICALLTNAEEQVSDLESAIETVLDERNFDTTFDDVMSEVLEGSFLNEPADEDAVPLEEFDRDDEPTSAAMRDQEGPGRLRRSLRLQLSRPEVRSRVRAIAAQFISPDTAAYAAWLRRGILDTLGEAVMQACISAAPRKAVTEGLCVDIHDPPDSAVTEIWVTETTIGGAGVLEAFANRFSSEPNLFFTAIEAALSPTDLEEVDAGLRQILELAIRDKIVDAALGRLRSSQSHAERENLWSTLARDLARRGGVALSHALSVSVNNRLLRSGSGPLLDRLLYDVVQYWEDVEGRFGFSVEVREFCYIASKNPDLAEKVELFIQSSMPGGSGGISVLSALQSLLWPRAHEIRKRALQSYNPFRRSRSTDPALVRHLLLDRKVPVVKLGDDDWQQSLGSALAKQGSVQLAAPVDRSKDLRAEIIRLSATPVDVGILQFFPAVERIDRIPGQILATMTLREHN